MPLYEYSCEACGQRFEALVPAGRADDAACTSCGAPARRLLSLIAAPVRGGDGAAAPASLPMAGGGGCCGGACGHC